MQKFMLFTIAAAAVATARDYKSKSTIFFDEITKNS